MIELNDNDILATIDFIISDDLSLSKIKQKYPEIENELNSYLNNKQKFQLSIFNFFYNIIKKDPKALSEYITNSDKFKCYLDQINKKRVENLFSVIEKNIQVIIIDVLIILLKNKEIVKTIKKDHPKIKAELTILSYECKNKIYKYFLDKSLKNNKCLTKYIKNCENFFNEFNLSEIAAREENYHGRTFYIPNNEKSWEQFALECKNKKFISFFVIEKDNMLEIYFL
jgi:hypothetical protein